MFRVGAMCILRRYKQEIALCVLRGFVCLRGGGVGNESQCGGLLEAKQEWSCHKNVTNATSIWCIFYVCFMYYICKWNMNIADS